MKSSLYIWLVLFVLNNFCFAKMYTDSTNNIKIDIPKSWIVMDIEKGPMLLKCLPKKELKISANFNIIKHELKAEQKSVKILQLVNETIESNSRALPRYKPSKPKSINVNGLSGYSLSATYVMGPKDLKNLQFFIKNGSEIYCFTFTSSIELYEKLFPEIMNSFHSFKVLKK